LWLQILDLVPIVGDVCSLSRYLKKGDKIKDWIGKLDRAIDKAAKVVVKYISRAKFKIDQNKFGYFFGKVKAPDPGLKITDPKKYAQLDHNYKRSQQMKKILESKGMRDTPKGREKLLKIFDKAADGTEISRHVGDYGTTITKYVETSGIKYEVKFFYEGGNFNLKPKVITMIPKVLK